MDRPSVFFCTWSRGVVGEQHQVGYSARLVQIFWPLTM